MIRKSLEGKWLVLILLGAMVLAACGGATATNTPQATNTANTGANTSPTAATDTETPTEEATAPDEATAGATEAQETEPSTPPGAYGEYTPAPNAANLKGSVVADGSSTVEPITVAAAEEFKKISKNVNVTVGESGTSGGFERFCAGQTDISNASRPIKEEEVAACQKAGVEYIELPVAFDGLAVMVNPANDWVDCLTVKELNTMWRPEAEEGAEQEVMNWNQVRQGFPDRELVLYGPGNQSGTFDYFNEAINGDDEASRSDYNASENDNILVQGISGDENALGYFGLAYYQANQAKLKLLGVDSGNGQCVKPSAETVRSGAYQPLSRPLFIYISKQASTRPEVKEFVQFYLSKSFTPTIGTAEVGYITLTDQLYAGILKRFQAGTTGTLFPKGAEVGATLDRYLK